MQNVQEKKDKLKKIFEKHPELFEKVIYHKDVVLFSKGNIATNNYYVESGMIRLYIYEPNLDKEATVAFLFAGEAFIPYSNLIKNRKAPTNAEVLKGSVLRKINAENWEKLLNQEPELPCLVAESLDSLVNETITHLANLAFYTTKEHIEILRKSQKYSDKFDELTDAQRASFFGVTESSFNRIKNGKNEKNK